MPAPSRDPQGRIVAHNMHPLLERLWFVQIVRDLLIFASSTYRSARALVVTSPASPLPREAFADPLQVGFFTKEDRRACEDLDGSHGFDACCPALQLGGSSSVQTGGPLAALGACGNATVGPSTRQSPDLATGVSAGSSDAAASGHPAESRTTPTDTPTASLSLSFIFLEE